MGRRFRAVGPIIYVSIYAIAPSLMFPGVPLTILGGALFGPFMGHSLRLDRARRSAPLWRSRCAAHGQAVGRKKIENTRLQNRRGRRKIRLENRGLHEVHTSFPFNVLNYAFGMTRIRFSRFVAASFVFMLPGVAAHVPFSSSSKTPWAGRFSWSFWQASLIVILFLIPLVYKSYPLFKGAGYPSAGYPPEGWVGVGD